MKKFLGAALSAALILPSGWVNAELLKNLKVDGRLDIQAVSANNATDFTTKTYDQIGDAQTRLMLNAGWDLLDDVHSMVSVTKNNRAYGQASEAVNTALLTKPTIDQANIKIDKLIGSIDATLGRQFYGEDGDLVAYFGPRYNNYQLNVTALDAFRFDWAWSWANLTGLVGKIASNGQGTAGTPASDSITGGVPVKDLRALNLGIKGNDMLSGAVNLYDQVTHLSANAATPVANDNLWVLGGKAKLALGGLAAKAEFDKNFGENRTGATPANYTGWAFLLNLAYKLDIPSIGGFTPWGEFGIGSGGSTANRNFTPIAGDASFGGIYSMFGIPSPVLLGAGSGVGAAGVSSTSLQDRSIWGIGLKHNCAMFPKASMGVSYWDYRYQSTTSLAAAQKGNTHIGSEVDLDWAWAHSDNVSFGLGLGSFQPGGAIGNTQTSLSPALLAKSNVTVRF